MTVIDGHTAIVDEIDGAPASLREVVVKAVRELATRKDLSNALAGY